MQTPTALPERAFGVNWGICIIGECGVSLLHGVLCNPAQIKFL